MRELEDDGENTDSPNPYPILAQDDETVDLFNLIYRDITNIGD